MIGLDQTADVYTADGSSGAFTVLAKSGLSCRLAHAGALVAGPGGERVELMGLRRLLWDETYAMPAEAQVEVDGQRWNVKAGTYTVIRGPGGQEKYRRCDVAEA